MSDERDHVELADYLSVMWRRKFLILLGTLVAMIAAAVVVLLQPNMYRARATLVVLPPQYKTELTPTTFSVHTYTNLLKSPELMRAIIDTLHLQDVTVEELDRDVGTEIIQEKYGAQRIDYSPLIRLYAKATHPEKAKDIANTWAELFVEQVRGLSFKGKAGALDFIVTQFEETEGNLEKSEDELREFQSRWRIELLEKELTVREETLVEYESSLYQARLDIATTKEELVRLNEEMQNQDEFIVLSKAITDDALWEKVTRDSSSPGVEKLDDLKLRSETVNPIFQTVKQQIIDNQVKLNGLMARKKYLESEIEKRKKEIGTLQKTIVEKRLEEERLTREINNYKKTYDLLAEKAESARLAKAEEGEDIKIATRAIMPQCKIGPRRAQTVLTAGIVAFVVMVFLVFFLEYATRNRSQAEVRI